MSAVKLCECGCGEPAPIAKRTQSRIGHFKGQPIRYIRGHVGRTMRLKERWEERDCGYVTPCHIFLGSKDRQGYGRTDPSVTGERLAHRDSYARTYGPIPAGTHVHHRCENPPCINPVHLRALTPAQHNRLSRHTREAAQATHCPHGHELTPNNILLTTGGTRKCKTCQYQRNAAWRRDNPPTAEQKARYAKRRRDRRAEAAA